MQLRAYDSLGNVAVGSRNDEYKIRLLFAIEALRADDAGCRIDCEQIAARAAFNPIADCVRCNDSRQRFDRTIFRHNNRAARRLREARRRRLRVWHMNDYRRDIARGIFDIAHVN